MKFLYLHGLGQKPDSWDRVIKETKVSDSSVCLSLAGVKRYEAAAGNGPVDAGIKAVKKAISNSDMTIQEFLIQAINKGSDDTGKVHMQVEYKGNTYYGFSANTDIIAASVEAFIDAINKFIIE